MPRAQGPRERAESERKANRTRGFSRAELNFGLSRDESGEIVRRAPKKRSGFRNVNKKISAVARRIGPEVTLLATAVVGAINPAAGMVAAKAQERWLGGVAERRYENDLDDLPALEPYLPEQAEIKRNHIIARRETQGIIPVPPGPKRPSSRGTSPGLRSGVFSIPILGDFFALLFGR